jgi:hypothetical protein
MISTHDSVYDMMIVLVSVIIWCWVVGVVHRFKHQLKTIQSLMQQLEPNLIQRHALLCQLIYLLWGHLPSAQTSLDKIRQRCETLQPWLTQQFQQAWRPIWWARRHRYLHSIAYYQQEQRTWLALYHSFLVIAADADVLPTDPLLQTHLSQLLYLLSEANHYEHDMDTLVMQYNHQLRHHVLRVLLYVFAFAPLTTMQEMHAEIQLGDHPLGSQR